MAETQERAYPDIALLITDLDADAVYARALDVANGMGWEIVAEDAEDHRFEAIERTSVFYFADDVVVAVAPQIDTEGRGQGNQLHAHSCKPTGDDVLFSYLPDSNMIQSTTYDDLRMAYNAPENAEKPFGLIACDPADEAQTFIYEEASMEMRLDTDETHCVTVSPTIDNAGPYQSRDLLLAACETLELSFWQWVIQG